MRSYEEALAASHNKSAFSNGSEGYAWMANWCDQCIHDRSVRVDGVAPDPRNGGLVGCALVGVSLMNRTPVEWIDKRDNGHRLGDTYHCTEFRDETDGDGDPPPTGPDPVLPGQVDMFEVFADQIADQAATVETVPT